MAVLFHCGRLQHLFSSPLIYVIWDFYGILGRTFYGFFTGFRV